MRLDLGHEVDRARAGVAERRRVDPVEVVAGDDEPARHRHPLAPVDLDPAGEPHRRPDRGAAYSPDLVGGGTPRVRSPPRRALACPPPTPIAPAPPAPPPPP